MNHDEIRQSVRESYGAVARADNVKQQKPPGSKLPASAQPFDTVDTGGCCGSTAGESCCGPGDLTSDQLSAIMGYQAGDLTGVPEGANMGLGCGNPVALASLKPGETVVDLGSGGGFDCFLAAREVGQSGQVIGVDMTPDMVSKARKNAEKNGSDNVDFRLGEIEHLPVADNTVDIVMSNCVINLSPDKQSVYAEAFRILKPGGRLSISDILATAELPDEVKQDLALVSACIGGAATIQDTKKMLQLAGFEDVKIVSNQKSQELIDKWDPNKSSKAGDYVMSANIEGKKPM